MVHAIENQPNIKQVKINDSFWGFYQNLILKTVIPYQEKILKDEIPGIEKSHAIENFKIAAGLSQGEFYGTVFQDSDLAKWMEAVSNALAISDDPCFKEKADTAIQLISAAQQEDGYLDTYFQIKEPDKKWNNLQECHEMYCMGHMIEAAVSHYESTGETNFLKIGKKIADCIDRRFGKNKVRGIPGHPEIEIALMRLYHATGEKRYCNLAKYFIDERGTEPNYFAEEAKNRKVSIWYMDPEDRNYTQNNKPLRELDEAVGHAVRAGYLYTAMADLAAETGDQELYDACRRLWENIVYKKMYLTGAIGSTAKGEAFTISNDLPNDTIYAETCAQISMIFFTRMMLRIRPSGEYADVMERIFFNGMLSGMQHDGERFFYVNPLEVVPSISGKLFGYEHVLPQRPRWYACACCPPNVARLLTSISRYCWGENDNTIYSHMFLGGEYTSSSIEGVKLNVSSEYPWHGHVTYEVAANSQNKEFSLSIHIPSWAENCKIMLNSEAIGFSQLTDGYLTLKRNWKTGDILDISFEMSVRMVYSNADVREDIGLVGVVRGPIVYALEEKENGAKLWQLKLEDNPAFTVSLFKDDMIDDYIGIETEGKRIHSKKKALYSSEKPPVTSQKIHFIPYFLWGNRGTGEMRVWIHQ
ncbi:glycoside hydrolase family 127 protein [Lachnoclostridium sp. Marseille-P6806]|uniref:glycoside hydrolase family 127 protein n=1 Tax=Lachnoclostridium sp. Marseille-P6806 TaxID=2364793 RepID=UPI001031E916|nr:beta-L-arabinofuranosidase domain-containing protein [Lachnoclostridium sp. Marseille-P6806]